MSSRTGCFWLLLVPCLLSGVASAATLTVANPRSAYPEGPVISGGAVYYAEMGADRVMRWDGRSNAEVWSRSGCLPTSVAHGAGDSLIVLCHREGALVRIAPTGETLAVVDAKETGGLFVNPNASVNDQKGGVYFSSSGPFAPDARPEGAILYLGADGRLERVAGNIRYANGVALSPDGGILYVSEHLNRQVLAFDVSADGLLAAPRVFLKLDDVVGPAASWEVGPDGLAVDSLGNLYIAEYGGGRLVVVDPGAKLLATIDIPEAYVTAPALIDDERHIFVTAPVSFFDPAAFGKVYVVDNPVLPGD
jgi:sugar lactone lactonase YvrE